jgi:hypothetical protein
LVFLSLIHILLFQIIHWFRKWIFSGHDNLPPTCSIHKDGLEAYRWCRSEIWSTKRACILRIWRNF